MVEVLTKSLEKDGDMRITNARLKNALVARGYVELSMGYGYGFGGIQSITPAGREALREYQAFQQSVHADLPYMCSECGADRAEFEPCPGCGRP